MDKIILLIGGSGSGKTTIAKELEELGYNIIDSYTTREPREPNEWGHIFVKKVPKDKSKMIAYFKGYEHSYWATKSQYQGKGTSIYVIDPKGALECKGKVQDAEVISIFLDTPATIRAKRMVSERSPTETIERLRGDRIIFKDVVADYTINGARDIQELVMEIVEIIEGGNNYE